MGGLPLHFTPEEEHFFLEMGERKRRTCEDTDMSICWGKRGDVGNLDALSNSPHLFESEKRR